MNLGYTCPEVDEYTCANCRGHNRCEHEMEAGFGEYEAPDVDRCARRAEGAQNDPL
jgi:hypothetical protein